MFAELPLHLLSLVWKGNFSVEKFLKLWRHPSVLYSAIPWGPVNLLLFENLYTLEHYSLINRADGKSHVRQYFGFCAADSEANEDQKSAVQLTKHCLTWDFLSALLMKNRFGPRRLISWSTYHKMGKLRQRMSAQGTAFWVLWLEVNSSHARLHFVGRPRRLKERHRMKNINWMHSKKKKLRKWMRNAKKVSHCNVGLKRLGDLLKWNEPEDRFIWLTFWKAHNILQHFDSRHLLHVSQSRVIWPSQMPPYVQKLVGF